MQVTELSGELDTARTDNAELSAKLTRLAEEQRAERGQLRELGSALEIARVQLIQLRGAGQTVGGTSGQQQEIQNLDAELQATRKSLAEALGNLLLLILTKNSFVLQKYLAFWSYWYY